MGSHDRANCPLDPTNFHTLRRSGIARLATSASRFGLDEGTVERVVTAAFAIHTGFDCSHVTGATAVYESAAETNGREWADVMLGDTPARWSEYQRVHLEMMRWAALHFARLPAHTRLEVVGAVEMDFNQPHTVVAGTGIRISGWTIPHGWVKVLQLRLNGAAKKYDNWYGRKRSTSERPTCSLEEMLENGDRALGTALRILGGDGDRVASQAVEMLTWETAAARLRHPPEEGPTPRAGAPRRREQTVCTAAGHILQWGCRTEEVRIAWSDDTGGRRLLSWWALQRTCPDTWGMYPQASVPTDEVLRDAAAAATGDSAGFLRAVAARHADLCKRGRLLNLIEARVDQVLRTVYGDTDDAA